MTADILWAADRNTVVDPYRDRQQPRGIHALAVAEMEKTRKQLALSDVWRWLHPLRPGYTHGPAGDRKRYDTWDCSSRCLQGEHGVIGCAVVPALVLSVPYATRRAAGQPVQKVSDHDVSARPP